jgi:ABC-2 type transport system permease protein
MTAMGRRPTGVIARITVRLLLGTRRAAAIGLVLLLPIAIAVVYRLSGEEHTTTPAEFAWDFVSSLILTLLLPLVALVLGTTALGTEIEDGTVVFLLTKPVDRWKVVVVKAAVAAAATAVLAVPTTAATAWIIVGSPGEGGLVAGLALAALVASVVYTVLFVMLSTITSRALVIGLLYVFVWEAILGNVFSGMAWLSVRQYALGWAQALISLDEFDADLSTGVALALSLIVVASALVIGSRKLRSFEIGERA